MEEIAILVWVETNPCHYFDPATLGPIMLHAQAHDTIPTIHATEEFHPLLWRAHANEMGKALEADFTNAVSDSFKETAAAVIATADYSTATSNLRDSILCIKRNSFLLT